MRGLLPAIASIRWAELDDVGHKGGDKSMRPSELSDGLLFKKSKSPNGLADLSSKWATTVSNNTFSENSLPLRVSKARVVPVCGRQ